MLLVAMVSISSQSSIYNSQKHKQIQITQVGHTKMYHAHFMMFNQHKIISFQKVSKNIVLNMKTGNLSWKVKWFRLQNAWNMVSITFSNTFFSASLFYRTFQIMVHSLAYSPKSTPLQLHSISSRHFMQKGQALESTSLSSLRAVPLHIWWLPD